MERYLIETPHTAHDCQMLVDEVYAMGYLNHFGDAQMEFTPVGQSLKRKTKLRHA
jgi:hypothetical protein